MPDSPTGSPLTNRFRIATALAAGYSLANLCFVGVWSDLLPFLYPADALPVGGMPCWRDFTAVAVNVLVAGLPLTVAAYVAQRGTRWRVAADLVLLAALAVAANTIRYHFRIPGEQAVASLSRPVAIGLMASVGVAGLAGFWRWRRVTSGTLHIALLVMFPLVPMQFAQAAWAVSRAGTDMQCPGPGSLATPVGSSPERRVLLIAYDELEYATVFESRPSDLRLPVFDSLGSQSLLATAMTSPVSRTERAVPSVLTGRAVREANLTGRNQLELTYQDGESALFSPDETIFARARSMGLNSGLAGFFLPYCSMIGSVLTTCTWEPCVTCGRRVGAFGATVLESMRNQVSELAPRYGPRRHLRAYRTLQERAQELAADPGLGLVFLHLPVPHDPFIYDRRTGEYSLRRRNEYLDNLALVDRSLGEILDVLTSSGLAPRTSVLVFGDHGRRSSDEGMTVRDPRVTFLVKLAGQAQGMTYTNELELAVVHDLVLAILGGDVSEPAELEAWLDGRSGRAGRPD